MISSGERSLPASALATLHARCPALTNVKGQSALTLACWQTCATPFPGPVLPCMGKLPPPAFQHVRSVCTPLVSYALYQWDAMGLWSTYQLFCGRQSATKSSTRNNALHAYFITPWFARFPHGQPILAHRHKQHIWGRADYHLHNFV